MVRQGPQSTPSDFVCERLGLNFKGCERAGIALSQLAVAQDEQGCVHASL